MKVKIIGQFEYQTYPISGDMVEIDDDVIKEIGVTKCFDNGQVIDFTPPEDNTAEINEKTERLTELTKDLAQVQAGLVIDDIEERKAEFRTLLNEIRVLQGKKEREIAE